MAGFFLILSFLVLGIGLRHFKILPESAGQWIINWVIWVAIPATAFVLVPHIEWQTEHIMPIAMPWLVFLLGLPVFILLGKSLGWDKATIGCVALVCGLGNTSFVGFPLLQFFYGDEGVQIGLLADQPGSFFVVSTLGVATAGYYSVGKWQPREIAKRVLTFPPFVAFVLALFLPAEVMTGTLQTILEAPAATLSATALLAVGFHLQLDKNALAWKPIALGLTYKLLLAPLVIWLLYMVAFNQSGMIAEVSVIEAAMAPMVTAAIVATNYQLNPKLASLLTGIGIPLSLLTATLWWLSLS